MRGPVRWGNVIVAKLVELLWWNLQPRFTDVGCTYRAPWRDAYEAMRPLLRGVGPELSPEMMVAALQARRRVIEVPVSYHRRIGGRLLPPAHRREIEAFGELLTDFADRPPHALDHCQETHGRVLSDGLEG